MSPSGHLPRSPRARRRAPDPQQQSDTTRVAVYTRKSVEAGTDEAFTSLDAQRAAVESYVTSQAGKGWRALKTRYDDNGFTGANLERPGFQALMQDIERGRVDVVAVYRLDRLSRRQLDFLQLLEVFESRGVEFCSVTEQFSTGTPTGRLILSIVGTFAQFEREVNSDRTSHKILESRRKGLWTGGRPVLGYDVVDKRLVVNQPEAEQVGEIFRCYIRHESIRLACQELAGKGIRLKRHVTLAGRLVGGADFSKNSLSATIQNPLYIGSIWAGEEMVDGAQPAILERKLWEQANTILERNRRKEGSMFRNRHRYLLRGLLKCGRCGSAMTFVTSVAREGKRYGSYVCQRSQRQGAWSCPGARAPVRLIEGPVVEKVLTLDAAVLTDPWIRGLHEVRLGQEKTGKSSPSRALKPPPQAAEERRAAWRRLNQKERAAVLRAALLKATFDPESGEVAVYLHSDEQAE